MHLWPYKMFISLVYIPALWSSCGHAPLHLQGEGGSPKQIHFRFSLLVFAHLSEIPRVTTLVGIPEPCLENDKKQKKMSIELLTNQRHYITVIYELTNQLHANNKVQKR